MKLSEMTISELFVAYKDLDDKLRDITITSQSNPGPILESRYCRKMIAKIYDELQNRMLIKNNIASTNREKNDGS